jgi:DNA polymerase-3 subunit epsilon
MTTTASSTPAQRPLRLVRPIVVFDLETTGLDVENDRIVEISVVKLHPNGDREVRTRRLNPGMAIPAAATAVHGIADEDVRESPSFSTVARSLHAFFAGCDLSGFNIEKFDIPVLFHEFKRCGLVFPEPGTHIVDTYRIYVQREPRDLTAALRYFTGREMVSAHTAEADAIASADILLGQIQKYTDLPDDVPGLHAAAHPRDPSWADADGKFVWRDDEIVCMFGKHRGRTLRELADHHEDYLRWILNGNFPLDVKALVSAAINGEYPQRPAISG